MIIELKQAEMKFKSSYIIIVSCTDKGEHSCNIRGIDALVVHFKTLSTVQQEKARDMKVEEDRVNITIFRVYVSFLSPISCNSWGKLHGYHLISLLIIRSQKI